MALRSEAGLGSLSTQRGQDLGFRRGRQVDAAAPGKLSSQTPVQRQGWGKAASPRSLFLFRRKISPRSPSGDSPSGPTGQKLVTRPCSNCRGNRESTWRCRHPEGKMGSWHREGRRQVAVGGSVPRYDRFTLAISCENGGCVNGTSSKGGGKATEGASGRHSKGSRQASVMKARKER